MAEGATKTTLELPDDLVRELKLRAVTENRRIKDVATDALRKGLVEGEHETRDVRRRVEFPLVRTVRKANPGEDLTPEGIVDILLDQEVEWARGAADR